MNKIGEYQTKKLNSELALAVAEMPSSMRAMFGDQKFLNTEQTIKKYNEITNKLPEQLESILVGALQIDKLEKEVDDQVSRGLLFADAVSQSSVQSLDESTPSILEQSEVRHPVVPVCYAEDIVAQGIAANREAIVDVTSSMHSNYNSFIKSVSWYSPEYISLIFP